MSDSEKSSTSRSFVGRWSQRKLQKKSDQPATKPNKRSQEETVAEQPVDNVLLQDEFTSSPVHPMIAPEPEHVESELSATALSQELDSLEDVVLATESENANESDVAEVEEPLLTDADMPDINSLTEQSDVSMFLNRGVSAALRKSALNYIFSLPAYNIRDGLNDYDHDYSVWEPLGDTVTCDMKYHAERKEKLRLEEERLERERLAAEAEAEAAETDEGDELAAESSEDERQTDDEQSNQNEPHLHESNQDESMQVDTIQSESESEQLESDSKTGSVNESEQRSPVEHA